MLPRSAVRARADAVSIEHPLSHFPRHPLCDICSCAKLFSKRVKSHRGQDPDADVPEPSKFGEQIAIDHMVVSKSSGGRVFLFCSGIFITDPFTTKSSDFVYSCLGRFVGLHFKNPDTVCRSHAAPKLIKAMLRLCWRYVTPSLSKDLQDANFSSRTPPRTKNQVKTTVFYFGQQKNWDRPRLQNTVKNDVFVTSHTHTKHPKLR